MPTAIFPRRRKPGRYFVIVDIPQARLVDPSVAVFTRGSTSFTTNLLEGPQHRAALGRIPFSASGGMYGVSVRPPSGAPFNVGEVEIIAASAPEEPSIEPLMGAPGSSFVIRDPQGRMAPGDVCIFYEAGSDPDLGTLATVEDVTPTVMNARVPSGIGAGLYQVTVREAPGAPPRFADLQFTVE